VLVPVADWQTLKRAARPTLKDLLLADKARGELTIPARGGRRRRSTWSEMGLGLINDIVYDRTRNFLCRGHKVQGRGTNRFSREHVYAELEVLCLPRERSRPPPWALR
jgi:hypothetical protein